MVKQMQVPVVKRARHAFDEPVQPGKCPAIYLCQLRVGQSIGFGVEILQVLQHKSAGEPYLAVSVCHLLVDIS